MRCEDLVEGEKYYYDGKWVAYIGRGSSGAYLFEDDKYSYGLSQSDVEQIPGQSFEAKGIKE